MSRPAMRSAVACCEDEGVTSIPELVARRKCGDRDAFKIAVGEARSDSIKGLIRRLTTVEDALMLWVLHLELDHRDVPPCLRGVKRDETPQVLFVTWLADIYWVTKRHRDHVPRYERWRGLFENKPATERWHRVAIWVYRSGRSTPSHYHTRGLGLTEAQRQPLMTLISNAMRGDRRVLGELPKLRDEIWLYVGRHPDRSGKFTSTQIADRRAEILRLFLLSGRNKTRAAEYYRLLTGQSLSRQTLTRHLEGIELATKLRSLCSR